MEYHRSPFREKQSNYDMTVSPKRPSYRNEQISFTQKQNPARNQFYMNKTAESSYRNTLLEGNSKHITSQMITQFDNEFNEKQQRTYKRQTTYEGQIDSNRSKFEQNKKFNAKHLQIESKLSKIQSYHHKIETLLDMVNKKPKTPSKVSDFTSPFTPNKMTSQQQSIMGSRSVAKISPLVSKTKNEFEGYKQTSSRQIRQQKYGELTQTNYSRYNRQQQVDNDSKESNCFGKNHFKKTSTLQEPNQVDNRIVRQNKYFGRDNKGPSLRNQEEFKQSNRKKSKQYMKSIEGQVRDIQTTIELLNEKIKQVDQISFKKQVAFDNLSTSNPESITDFQQKDFSQISKNNTPLRTPTRFNKESQLQNSPANNYTCHRKMDLSPNTGSVYKNEGSFRKTTNGISTSSKYDAYSNERNIYKNQPLKICNPYDGDVEQSEERNRYTLMQQIRRKRN